MNKTKIEWADYTWNPVTGCLHNCPYCYARGIARRFCTNEHGKEGLMAPCAGDCRACQRMDGLEFYETNRRYANGGGPFPYGFFPTFYPHRLNEPRRVKKPGNIFTVSMGDLFGAWVPERWILDVFDACAKAPQHRYLFLTKNTDRYMELDYMALLPHAEKFWYGTSVTSEKAAIPYPGNLAGRVNTFWSAEPLHGPVSISEEKGVPGWVIVGAETGNRAGKIIPKREWIDKIADDCARRGVPLFMKDSLLPIVGAENMVREFPR